MFKRVLLPCVAVLTVFCAGCATIDTNTDDVVSFVFAQPTTECDVYVGNQVIGRVSIANSAVGVRRGNEPLRLACAAAGHAPISAEVAIVRTRDEAIGVLGVNVPTARALGARVTEPVANLTPRGIPTLAPQDKTGYPPRITVDIARRQILVPDGWQTKM